MAKKNNVLETIKEKQTRLSVIESIIKDMRYNIERNAERLADNENNLAEYVQNYDEEASGIPLEDDWRYNDYMETITDARLRSEVYDDIQALLLKLI